MQIGNMPSIDEVNSDGYIIYSEDGVHTQKMSISDFANAVGILMTGEGDGDGGDGLIYWTEESARIFRDLMTPDENEFRRIRNNKVFGRVVDLTVGCESDPVEVSPGTYQTFGFTLPRKLMNGTYNEYEPGQSYDTHVAETFSYFLQHACRYPAISALLDQPDSKYYCNLIQYDNLRNKKYSQLDTQSVYDDMIVNPLGIVSKDYTYTIDPSSAEPQTETRTYSESFDQLNCTGQDRRYFGLIKLNVDKGFKFKGHVTYSDPFTTGATIDPRDYQSVQQEKAAAKDAARAEIFRQFGEWKEQYFPPHSGSGISRAQFVGGYVDEDPSGQQGEVDYIFNLFCIGNINEIGEEVFNRATSPMPMRTIKYTPLNYINENTLSVYKLDSGIPDNERMIQFSISDDDYTTDDYEQLDNAGTALRPMYVAAPFTYKDTRLGFEADLHKRALLDFDDDGVHDIWCRDYMDCFSDLTTDPSKVRDLTSSELETLYSKLISPNYTYNDRTDVGAAYFVDDDGTVWCIVLIPKEGRDVRDLLYDWGNGTSTDDDDTFPLNYDKSASYLELDQTYNHWSYRNDSDLLDAANDDLRESWWTKYGLGHNRTNMDFDAMYDDATVVERSGSRSADSVIYDVTIGPAYFATQYKYDSLNREEETERISNIGKAVLNALGLHGIAPLDDEVDGIHSEIAANSDTVLNGGRYLTDGSYQQTYNLNGRTGSLYLLGDAYDNGKKIKEAYQRMLEAGSNITMEENEETGNIIISSTGGGGGSINVTMTYDSENKRLTFSGIGDKDIILYNYGIYFEGSTIDGNYVLKPKFDISNSSHLYADTKDIDIKQNYHESTQRKIMGGEHVFFYPSKNQPGHNPMDSAMIASDYDKLYTDCIDTIKVDGTALTKSYDSQNDSYYVDIQSSSFDELPSVSGSDNGKVLKVVNGAWTADTLPNNLPAVSSSDNGKILKVSNGAWDKGDESTELPAVTTNDDGKALFVENGAWTKGPNLNNFVQSLSYNGTQLSMDQYGDVSLSDFAMALPQININVDNTVIYEETNNPSFSRAMAVKGTIIPGVSDEMLFGEWVISYYLHIKNATAYNGIKVKCWFDTQNTGSGHYTGSIPEIANADQEIEIVNGEAVLKYSAILHRTITDLPGALYFMMSTNGNTDSSKIINLDGLFCTATGKEIANIPAYFRM